MKMLLLYLKYFLIIITKKTNKIFFYNCFFLYIKITNKNYQNHKEKLLKEARERY